MKINKGKFIAFEGLDGSGSSTQVLLLANRLNYEKRKTFVTKEPTNNIIGGLIRGLLTRDWSISSEGLQLLFSADRAHHLHREILPEIERGNNMVTDRYFFSTFAFGSIDLPLAWLQSINSRFPLPDLTILLKVRPEVCLRRISKSRQGKEFFEQKEKLEKTWKTYEKLAEDKKNKIIIVDGERLIEDIAEDIYQIVKKKLF